MSKAGFIDCPCCGESMEYEVDDDDDCVACENCDEVIDLPDKESEVKE